MASPPEPASSKSVATLQAVGTLVVAILILIVTLIRYWHHIPWGAR